MTGENESSSGVVAEVVIGSQVLADAQLGDMVWGHVSLRDPEGRGVYMKAAGFGFDEITPEQVVLVSWDGDVLSGEGPRHIEYPIHTEIMKARPDVNSVVHVHAFHATAFAATGETLRPVSHDATLFVPPDIPRFVESGDLIMTSAMGESLARTLGDRNAALIPHHGVAVVGGSVPESVFSTVLLERACAIQLTAGRNLRTWSSDEEALAKRDKVWSAAQVDAGWKYLVRRLDRSRDR